MSSPDILAFPLASTSPQQHPPLYQIMLMSRQQRNGFVPLHSACVHRRLLATKLIVIVFPGSSTAVDGNNKTALQLAAGGVDAPIVNTLIEAWPEGVRIPDHRGDIPLMIAARYASDVVIRCLLAAWPDGARCRTRDGHCPLFLALVHYVEPDAILALIEAWPEGVRQRSNGTTGKSVLQTAIDYGTDPKVINAMRTITASQKS